jgi:tetratricopeptide (TPR) repeat protein
MKMPLVKWIITINFATKEASSPLLSLYSVFNVRNIGLGEIDKAIEFYTKSMDALEPFSIAYFWRGRLYYEQELWDKAQSDFEQALSPENGELDSMDRNEAEDYLAKLKMMRDS